jgi:uncharacterized Zn finger protein (UPF0148 family)
LDSAEHGREATLICPTCGSDLFEYDDEDPEGQATVTCASCGLRLTRDELIEENAANLDAHAKELAEEAIGASVKGFQRSLREAFKGSKNNIELK